MAVIRERIGSTGKKSYHVQVRLKGHPPQTKSFESKTLAKQWAQQVETEMRHGRWMARRESESHTVEEALQRYLTEHLQKRSLRRATDEQQLQWWLERFGRYTLADLTPALIATGRAELEAGGNPRKKRPAPSTVVRYMAILSKALSVIVNEWGWLSESPMPKVQKPRVSNGSTRFLSKEEVERLLLATKSSEHPHLHLITLLALSTGMRKGEILGLRWRQLHLDPGKRSGLILLEKTKNHEPRGIPLVEGALKEVLRHQKDALAQGKSLDALLFESARKPGQPTDIRKAWETAVEAAKLEGAFRFHDTRHTVGASLAMSGASMRDIAELLGHKDLAMVKRYSHLSKSHLEKVARKMHRHLKLPNV